MITCPHPYDQLYTTKKKNIVLKSGRDAGKSINVGDYIVEQATQAVNEDIVLCRANMSDMLDSIYAVVQKRITFHKLDMFFKTSKKPLRIVCKLTNCNIYFLGIDGDDNRTKSFEPINPKVRLFVFEELQQVRELSNLEQALATFRRHLDDDNGKIIFMFNPPPITAHWVNMWCLSKQEDNDFLVISSSWLDIIDYLNDYDIKEILKCKITEPDKYEWLYMGKTTGGFGSVYPQFKRDKHLITLPEAQEKFRGHYIKFVIIGGDNAIARDCTCLCPIAVFDNGQCLVLDLYFHDPTKNGDLSVAEQIPLMKKWLFNLEKKYHLTDRSFKVPIAFVIDGSIVGLELVKQLRFTLNMERYQVIAYKEKHVIEMANNLKSVFARNMLYIVDFGGIYNYSTDRFERRSNVLADQVETLVWNEKATGFDPIVPNDACDALTYGANAIFKNMFNLYYVQESINTRKDYYDTDNTEIRF